MNKNKITLMISTILPLVVSIPRVIFMLNGKNEGDIGSLIQVTVEDILIRILLLFSFSLVTLKFNLVWIERFKIKNRWWVSIVINTFILVGWILIFYVINTFFYTLFSSLFSAGINFISYFFFLVLLLISSKTIQLIEKSKLDAVEKEVLKQKSLQNELDVLKSQINPHFLFNSLNSLSLLVMEDQKAARTFINKLSFMFRYMLQSKDQDMVSIKEEVKFLESYIHLIKQRYRSNFQAMISIDEKLYQQKIPTLALQILMENAVKHNEISNENPLKVEVFDDEKYIVVRNKIQARTGSVESTHTGLSNLNSRFKLLMSKEIEIYTEDKYFTVKIPIS